MSAYYVPHRDALVNKPKSLPFASSCPRPRRMYGRVRLLHGEQKGVSARVGIEGAGNLPELHITDLALSRKQVVCLWGKLHPSCLGALGPSETEAGARESFSRHSLALSNKQQTPLLRGKNQGPALGTGACEQLASDLIWGVFTDALYQIENVPSMPALLSVVSGINV